MHRHRALTLHGDVGALWGVARLARTVSELRGVLLVVVSSWPCELRHGASLYTFGHRAKAPRELGAAPRWQGQGRPLVPVRSWDRVSSLDISASCFKSAQERSCAQTLDKRKSVNWVWGSGEAWELFCLKAILRR